MYGSWRAEDDIAIITLENLFTIDLYNDMCMLARERCIVLTEHQSSINENMPTSLLLYIAEEYKRLFSGEKNKLLHKSKRVPILERTSLSYFGKLLQEGTPGERRGTLWRRQFQNVKNC